MRSETCLYDALLVVSFGGPEGRDEVMPFLRNVVRGRNVPEARLAEVARHYERFGGVSPINEQTRALVAALERELAASGPALPVYWGNRNWRPFLPDAVSEMKKDGVRRALAFVTSAFGSYSGCRQYLEDIERARAEVGPGAPPIEKVRLFYNHPGFVEANVARVRAALEKLSPGERDGAHLTFTAHSLPLSMAAGSAYVAQLEESCRLVAGGVGLRQWGLAYQSRSGPPSQPWLEPDILDRLSDLRAEGARTVVLAPIGFLSDHLEVVYDLDVEAARRAEELGVRILRAETVGTHPLFIRMIRDLVRERVEGSAERPALGARGPAPDACPPDCCRAPGLSGPRKL